MKRWSATQNTEVENAKIDAFLAEVIEVSKKHGLSISHEDAHGAFEVKEFSESSADWLMNAHDVTRNT